MKTLIGLVAAAVLVSAPAGAVTIVDFSGSTEGCFGSSCTPTTNASVDHLTFNGTTFANIPAGAVTLGSFDLGNGTATYDTSFVLDISFSLPVGTTPGSDLFDATLSGAVHGGDGSVTINFDNAAQTFDFGNGGSFTVSVNDLTLNLGDPNLTGTITLTSVSAVPEPSTWAMMLLGFAGIGFLGYRRSQKAPLLAA